MLRPGEAMRVKMREQRERAMARRPSGFETNPLPSTRRGSVYASGGDASFRNLLSFRGGQASARAASYRAGQLSGRSSARSQSPSTRRSSRFGRLFSRRSSHFGGRRDSVATRSKSANFVGTFGRVENLSARDEWYNGSIGEVGHYDVPTGRFAFTTAGGEQLMVRATSVAAMPEEAARSIMESGAGYRIRKGAFAQYNAAASAALVNSSSNLLNASPVRRRAAANGNRAEVRSGGLRMLPDGRLMAATGGDEEVVPRSDASKGAPPRPWDLQRPSRRPPPPSCSPASSRARVLPLAGATASSAPGGSPGVKGGRRTGGGSPGGAPTGNTLSRDAAPRMHRPPQRVATHQTSSDAYAEWRKEGMPDPDATKRLMVRVTHSDAPQVSFRHLEWF